MARSTNVPVSSMPRRPASRNVRGYLQEVAQGREPSAEGVAALETPPTVDDRQAFERDVWQAVEDVQKTLHNTTIPGDHRRICEATAEDRAERLLDRWSRDYVAKARGTFDQAEEVRRLTALVRR